MNRWFRLVFLLSLTLVGLAFAAVVPPPASSAGFTSLGVVDFSDLNFKSKADIYQMRMQAVMRHADVLHRLGSDSYTPSMAVFGQITDKKPWWGLLGLSYYGNGEHSIGGPSWESLYINNPYLLIGLSEVWAHKVNGGTAQPQVIYPQLSTLLYNPRLPQAWADYDVTDHMRKAAAIGFPEATSRTIDLHDYNALDLGFHYLYLDPASSVNTSWPTIAVQPRRAA